jgi:hypothetical protein
VAPDVQVAVRASLTAGTGILKTAKTLGLGTRTVQRLKGEVDGPSTGSSLRRDRGPEPDAHGAAAPAMPLLRSRHLQTASAADDKASGLKNAGSGGNLAHVAAFER